jgi:DNA-binding phage protein
MVAQGMSRGSHSYDLYRQPVLYKATSRPYEDFLQEELRDPELDTAYLTAALEGSQEEFLLALRSLAYAHDGLGAVAGATQLNRQTIYRTLSDRGILHWLHCGCAAGGGVDVCRCAHGTRPIGFNSPTHNACFYDSLTPTDIMIAR